MTRKELGMVGDSVACLWLSRAELAHFLGERRTRLVPDSDFEWIAQRIGDACMEIFWDRLEELAREYASREAE